MIKRIFEKIKKWTTSLRFRFIVIFGIAAILGVAIYLLGAFFSNLYINNEYLSEEQKEIREKELLSDLQEYIDKNKISADNTEKIADWARENRYVYLLIYKGNELFFTSDDMPEVAPDDEGAESPGGVTDGEDSTTPGTSTGGDNNKDTDSEESGSTESGKGDSNTGGVTVQYPSREELLEYAKQNEMYLLNLAKPDETKDYPPVFAQFTEYTEYFYYDIVNIVFLLIAALAVVVIMIFYIRRVTGRIIRLGDDINRVAAGDTESIITADGKDEIGELAVNVESMRSSIVENYKREKEALDANTALITSMSHDIRTPLTVLLGYMDVMRAHADGDERMQEYIKAAESTAMRLKKLSDDMFGYFLVFGGKKLSAEIEKYEAETLIEQMLTEHILLIRESGYTLELCGFDSGVLSGKSVLADANSLVRIFDNAFSNLYKYADKEKPIKIELSADPCNIIIKFSNYIRKDGEKVESNGIGLKTCVKLAEMMNAKFEYGGDENIYNVMLSLQYK